MQKQDLYPLLVCKSWKNEMPQRVDSWGMEEWARRASMVDDGGYINVWVPGFHCFMYLLWNQCSPHFFPAKVFSPTLDSNMPIWYLHLYVWYLKSNMCEDEALDLPTTPRLVAPAATPSQLGETLSFQLLKPRKLKSFRFSLMCHKHSVNKSCWHYL